MELIIWDFLGTLYDSSKESLYPDSKDILQKTKSKYKQVLSSSGFNKAKRITLIKELEIWSLFDEVKIGLKSKRLFLNFCNKYNCKPKDVYVIGDNLLNEINTGNRLGMKTIWLNRKRSESMKTKIFRKYCWKDIYKLKELDSILNYDSK